MLEYILFLLQTISSIILAAIGIVSTVNTENRLLNKLSEKRKSIVLLSALVLFVSIVILFVLDKNKEALVKKNSDESLMRIRDLNYRVKELNTNLSILVMLVKKEAIYRPPKIMPTNNLTIIKPVDKVGVKWRTVVKGNVSDPSAKVWVIVHPVGLSSYWVQPQTTVDRIGNWKAALYLGRPGNVDLDKEFNIMAIINPMEALTEGKVLTKWPDAKWRSRIITVIRK